MTESSDHDAPTTSASEQDRAFIRNFTIVLGVLAGIAVGSLIAAYVLTTLWASGDMRPEQMTRIETRTQPVYAVNTNPNATHAPAATAGAGGGAPMSGKQIFQNVCTACHTAGVMGAPKVTNTTEWKKRLSNQGKKTLYHRAINGYKKMPAKGGKSSLSKKEMHNAVDYILGKAGAT